MFLLAMSMMIALPVCAKVKWTEEMNQTLKEMQDMYYWRCGVYWLESHSSAQGYVSNMDRYSIPSLKETRNVVAEALEHAQPAMKVIKAICGKKKGEKRQAALAKYFTDMERANRIVEDVERICDDAPMIIGAIDYELKHRKPAVMPEGRLLSFSTSGSNGFAGWRQELTLERNKNGVGGKLNFKDEKFDHWGTGEGSDVDTTVVVADSVFQRVRDMVENGQLYDIGRDYHPDYMITDASSWSLHMKFEKGSISSGGYASGPDHHDVLREIEKYLSGMCRKEKEK